MMRKMNEDVVLCQATSHGSIVTGAPVIYYDGSCPLCTVEINHYASRIDGSKLHLVDVSAESAELGSDLTTENAMRRFHVRKADGELVSGAKAFAEIWRVLPGWTWASRLASIPGVLPLMEVLYRSFLVFRPAISRLAARFGVQAANPKAKRHCKGGELDI
jgi:predicted DCC family thiol-disulfide oxidoreductase YuxK